MNRTRVKICGLTRAEDVACAVRSGAHAVGFVFARSPRRVEIEQALELASATEGSAVRVGLFMDQPEGSVRSVLRAVPLDMLQFHGREPNDFCRAFGLPFLKAIPMGDPEGRQMLYRYPDAAGLLLDSHQKGGAGGTGVAFDWARVPECPQPVWLAGGLEPANVAEAIRVVQPWAVDVSSGVEQAPGQKSHARIEAFMQAVGSVQGSPPE